MNLNMQKKVVLPSNCTPTKEDNI